MKDISKQILIWIALIIGVIIVIPIIIVVVDSTIETVSKNSPSNSSTLDSTISGSDNNKPSEIDMSYINDTVMSFPSDSELRDINPYDTLYSSGNSYEDLKQTIIINNKSCPIFIGEGMAVSSIKEERGWITHYCIVDEDVWNLQGMSQDELTIASMRAAMKDFIISSSTNDNLYRNTIKLYVINGKGIKYHFFGTKSHCSFDINYSISELRNIINPNNPR